jgi:hypothetical protein
MRICRQIPTLYLSDVPSKRFAITGGPGLARAGVHHYGTALGTFADDNALIICWIVLESFAARGICGFKKVIQWM